MRLASQVSKSKKFLKKKVTPTVLGIAKDMMHRNISVELPAQ
jgi:hypothetical protein